MYNSCIAGYETYSFFFPLDGAGEPADQAGHLEKIVINQ
jgi:hypothetical protein